MNGKLIVHSAPSGAGKTSIIKYLLVLLVLAFVYHNNIFVSILLIRMQGTPFILSIFFRGGFNFQSQAFSHKFDENVEKLQLRNKVELPA